MMKSKYDRHKLGHYRPVKNCKIPQLTHGEICLECNRCGRFKEPKYHSRKTEYNSRLYDSKKEAHHAGFLDMLKRAQRPSDRVAFWLPQVPFKFACGTKMIVDFLVCYADGHYELHEVKGGKITKTQAYRIKKRMLKHEHGLELKEV